MLRHEVLFSLHWWLLIAALLLGWWIWRKFVDQDRKLGIVLYGLLVLLTALLLDVTGAELGLWDYPHMVLP